MSKLVAYSNRTRYWQIYAFNSAPAGYTYKRGIDIPFHLTKTKNQFLLNTKIFAPLQGVSLYHTYNSIVANNKPWVVEVESMLPRYGTMQKSSKLYQWSIKKLRSENCKQIIFTSKRTYDNNKQTFEREGVDSSKLSVIYRAVERFKNISDQENTFNILFAGNGFYRKGGYELLKAFQLFKHTDARLTIISNFDIDWEVFPTQEEIYEVRKIINSDSRINILSNLAHQEVICEMQKSHVFVATTFSDPFNNTVLEALACGVPVITSRERAIPEFVTDNYNGFSMDIKTISKFDIIDYIKMNLNIYYEQSELRNSFSENAYKMCLSKFDIDVRNSNLKKIYDSALIK